MKMSASDFVKTNGFSSMKELSEIAGKDRQTLNRWFVEQPYFFKIVMLGALASKNGVTTSNFDFSRKRAKDLADDSFAELLRYVASAERKLQQATADVVQLRTNLRRTSF